MGEHESRERPRDLRIWIRLLTPLLIVGLAVGAYTQYRRATREAEARFNERQRFVARQAAARLAAVFDEARKLLSLLQHLDATRIDQAGLAALARVVGELGEPGAAYAWWVDGKGTPLLSTQKPGGALERLWRRLPRCPRVLEPVRGEGIALPRLCVRGPIRSTLTRSGWSLVVAIGVVTSSGGELALVLDWGEVRAMVERLTHLSPETRAWMLDGDGRLLLHPNHRDAETARALAGGLGCTSCHQGLAELHDEMRHGEAGSARIALGSARRLVAYEPVRVGFRSWSLAVATPAVQATRAEQLELATILIFPAGIMLVMVIGAVLLDREASRRIRAAAAFRADLERKVAERTGELAGLYARLSELQANHTRLERVAVAGELASIVAHEIRTPLNALSINAQMISRKLRRGGEGDREAAVELLGTVEKEVTRISDLLEEHLLALVRHRGAEPRPLSLTEALQEAIRFIEPEGVRRRVVIDSELAPRPLRILGDPNKLRQVLLNVLLNALQATPEGGRVRVSSRAEEGMAIVNIADSGPGIAWLDPGVEEDVERVFKPFVTTKQDGTGLGLAICVRLVKELRGRFRVGRSAELSGASFSLELPLQAEAGREPEE